MGSARLRFALEQLSPAEWLHFERFCSEFLVEEFPDLRTTATASGDGGRDAEVFAVPGLADTVFQYSVAADWRAKLRDTFTALDRGGRTYRRVVYCTNQRIGALADRWRAQVWDERQVLLDVRDLEWFCERERTSSLRQVAAADLAELVVDPIVSARGIAEVTGAPLTGADARVALVQLSLNATDRAGDRSLTKTSFDALVQSVLVDTSQEHRLIDAQVVERVRRLVPHGSHQQVAALTRSALDRLSRKRGPVKRHGPGGSYHLSHTAHEAWKESAASYVLDQESLEDDLAISASMTPELGDATPEQLHREARTLRIALETVLLRSGERFVAAVETGSPPPLLADELSDEIAGLALPLQLSPDQASRVVLDVVSTADEQTRRHLTRVLDAYTLLAFLQQTPDVQKALGRVFENARLWLDASVVLPLVAETLVDDPQDRPQTMLLSAATASGVRLHVTGGVIEELRHHLNRCTRYLRAHRQWVGPPPFLYTAFLLSGRDEQDFERWAEDIRGRVDPERDIEEYLRDLFGIHRSDLKDAAAHADPAVRIAVTELFRAKHTRPGRHPSGHTTAPGVVDRLVAHDVENAVGVLGLRGTAPRPALGHEIWWLTLDRRAFEIATWLKDRLGVDLPDASPALSPDYLAQLLRLGPLRSTLSAEATQVPAITVDVTRLDAVPPELVDLARATRASLQGLDERRVRREVRDALHRTRTTIRRDHDYAADVHAALRTGLAARSRAR